VCFISNTTLAYTLSASSFLGFLCLETIPLCESRRFDQSETSHCTLVETMKIAQSYHLPVHAGSISPMLSLDRSGAWLLSSGTDGCVCLHSISEQINSSGGADLSMDSLSTKTLIQSIEEMSFVSFCDLDSLLCLVSNKNIYIMDVQSMQTLTSIEIKPSSSASLSNKLFLTHVEDLACHPSRSLICMCTDSDRLWVWGLSSYVQTSNKS